MSIWLHTAVAITLLVIAYQDLRYRAIHWVTIPVLVILFGWMAARQIPPREVIDTALYNWVFLVIQWIGLTAYFSIRNRAATNITNRFLGLGDILFLGVAALAFSPLNFAVFIVSGFGISLVAHLLIYRTKALHKSIPLAGFLALWMLPFFTIPNWYAGPRNEQWLEILFL